MSMSGNEDDSSLGIPICCMDTGSSAKKKSKISNKRRFSDDQIRSLESIFEADSRLEPRKKAQLANDLGLQPRQVAIWFQNKRARWKSKELEKEYTTLRANYSALATRFEALKKEKNALSIQFKKLKGILERQGQKLPSAEGISVTSSEGESKDDGPSHYDKKIGENKNFAFEGYDHDGRLGAISDEDSSVKVQYFGMEEESNFFRAVEPDGSMTSHEDWEKLDTGDLFDHTNAGSQWWDYWC